ncbi:MAG: DciA family protein [Methylococcales bacterium]|nr:DciA family protein [Methylococcales bacterium]
MTSKKITSKTPLSYQNQTMAYFHGQIGQQKRLLQAIQKLLPFDLANHVHCCLIKDKKLLLYTDSAAWASQLRFYNGVILAANELLVDVVQIKVMTQEAGFVTQSECKARLPSSEKIAELQKDSLNIADEPLKAALLKLSATLARLSNKN